MLLDMEKWSGGTGTAAHQAAAGRKSDLVYNATQRAFPNARIEMYGRGAITFCDRYNHYTLDEKNANITSAWSQAHKHSSPWLDPLQLIVCVCVVAARVTGIA